MTQLYFVPRIFFFFFFFLSRLLCSKINFQQVEFTFPLYGIVNTSARLNMILTIIYLSLLNPVPALTDDRFLW